MKDLPIFSAFDLDCLGSMGWEGRVLEHENQVLVRKRVSPTHGAQARGLSGQGPNSVYQIDLLGATLHVSTLELSENMRGIYFFSVTPDVTPRSVTFASTYWAQHRRLERESRVDHPAERCQDYLSPKRIRLWASGVWSELPVEYTPKGGIPEK
jgi:hypothetical protein